MRHYNNYLKNASPAAYENLPYLQVENIQNFSIITSHN